MSVLAETVSGEKQDLHCEDCQSGFVEEDREDEED